MRISTQSFYEQSKTAMGSLQSNLLRVQQQLGAGTKILAPSDDPLGATRALAVSQSIALTAQYASSRSHATQTLTMEENALQSATTVLQNVKGLLIQAGGTMTDADRATIATTLQSNLDQLQGLANTDDGNGQFLFAGFKSGSAPFVRDANGSIKYAGDQGQRLMQVDVSRQMAGTDDGRSIFQTVQGGAGYVTESPVVNTGSGVFSSTSVIDVSDPNYGKDWVITFSPDGTKYTADTVQGLTPAPTATAYTAGNPIKFGGLQVSISGAPAAGDTFTVFTAKNAGTDVFAAINDVIKALKTPVDSEGPKGQALILNALSTANRKITNAHDNVLTVRASVGSRLQELDALSVTGDSRTLSDKSYLSDLQDLDYGSAIAEFYQRQTALQASQQTFVKIQQIALFNYL
ncbi:MAG: flagellar hook-associated protein FlgL [Polaromonas sp.]|jgi:flagellar hook-associated protein 3 FlgL|uniref:flagellar hook-associated protein FlgL n=1 Tax=Polaromonas sp. TaxID=1869339 RepID=UPI002732267C|nr:flagellar hook-associated protein FlgL [Polaromonas sp.]MDP2256785.1 flagellar hook-associated protein FlgL [Polaromonas sp.]